METIEEYIDYLFNCNFADDNFDAKEDSSHLEKSWELLEKFQWDKIYQHLLNHLHTSCKSTEDVINFVNLYVYYNFDEEKIPDPLDFVSYLYYKVDMDVYWDEAGDLFDGLAIKIFSNHDIVDIIQNPYYNPLKDERIADQISKFKTLK